MLHILVIYWRKQRQQKLDETPGFSLVIQDEFQLTEIEGKLSFLTQCF